MKKLHDIEWNEAKIQSFWDGLVTGPENANLYFSKQKGRSLLRFVRRFSKVHGRVVDLGCGPGYFIDHLLTAGISCAGADLSKDSVESVNQRLKKCTEFVGAQLCPSVSEVPFERESVDTLFLLETVEHLLPGAREQYLSRIVSTLAVDGSLIATVPYREDLLRNKVVCSDCGCRFHRVQHVASFDPVGFSRLMNEAGLTTVVCRPVLLWPDWKVYWQSMRISSAGKSLSCPECAASVDPGRTGSFVNRFTLDKLFHLVYVGRKETRG